LHGNVLVGGLDSCMPANMADSGGITRVPVRRRAGLALYPELAWGAGGMTVSMTT
jgi:hypothetical protein